MNVNVEPIPTWLLTQIRPPWSSTNFRHRVSPSPVPSCFAALTPTCRNSSKTASWSSGAMPTPLSLTETSTDPSTGTARTSIRPPSGVNLMALDNRFSTTCLIFRSSARTSFEVRNLLGGRSAIDHQLAARHERRLVGGEVDDAVGDVLRRPHPSHGQSAQTLLPVSFVLQHVLDHVGRNRAGMDGVAADAFLGVLDCCRLREQAHRALGRGVRSGTSGSSH